MATSESTMEFLMDQLAALPGVRTRKMFGEYALYLDEKVVALICDDQLFVKITPEGRAFVGENYQEGFPYPGAKPAMLIGAEELDNDERLCQLLRLTAAALPVPKPKQPRKAKGAAKSSRKASKGSAP